MTTYTFKASASSQSVSWGDPSVWTGGVVPNGPDADVIFPTITRGGGTFSTYTSFVTIATGQSYAARSVSVTNNYLILDGTLTVGGALVLNAGSELDMTGGTLTLGSLQNSGYDI